MKRSVIITPLALQDLEDIHVFIRDREGPQRALLIYDGLSETILKLDQQSQRGHAPPEAESMGLNDVLELHYKAYRIVYRVDKSQVHVFVVADGRRNFIQLLTRRLLH